MEKFEKSTFIKKLTDFILFFFNLGKLIWTNFWIEICGVAIYIWKVVVSILKGWQHFDEKTESDGKELKLFLNEKTTAVIMSVVCYDIYRNDIPHNAT